MAKPVEFKCLCVIHVTTHKIVKPVKTNRLITRRLIHKMRVIGSQYTRRKKHFINHCWREQADHSLFGSDGVGKSGDIPNSLTSKHLATLYTHQPHTAMRDGLYVKENKVVIVGGGEGS